jgi:pimeloyl-ACP methyl ester carboxylesterase
MRVRDEARVNQMQPIHLVSVLVLLALIVTFGAGTLYTILETKRVRAAHPPAGQFISVEGTRLHYVEQGRGRPVLLLHGNAGFVQDWSAVVPKLAAHYRVFAFDRPGHGASSRGSSRHVTPDVQARLINAALKRLTVQCPIIVGFSWGGGLSLIYALQYPAETCGLVLITPRAFPDEATRSLAYQFGRTPLLGDIFRYSVMLPIARRIIRDRLAAGYAPDPPLPEHIAAASDMWSRPGQAEATVWDSRNLDEALRSYSVRYHEITTPVLIVVGDHDRPDRESVPLSKKIPGAELVLIPRTGHLVPQVRPEAVITAIEAVAARSSAARGPNGTLKAPAER